MSQPNSIPLAKMSEIGIEAKRTRRLSDVDAFIREVKETLGQQSRSGTVSVSYLTDIIKEAVEIITDLRPAS